MFSKTIIPSYPDNTPFEKKLAIWGIKRAAECCISFNQFLKPMDIPDITLFTDAVLNIGLEGYSDEGHWFKNKAKNFLGLVQNFVTI